MSPEDRKFWLEVLDDLAIVVIVIVTCLFVFIATTWLFTA